MKFNRQLILLAALTVTTYTACSTNKFRNDSRQPANAEEGSIEITDSGEMVMDGERVEGQSGPVMKLMVARIEAVVPAGLSDAPVFRLQPLELHSRESVDGDVTVQKLDVGIRTLQADSSWRFYNSENNISSDGELNMRDLRNLRGKVAVFPVSEETTAEKVDVVWNECTGPFTGNYAAGKEYACAPRRPLNDEYAGFLKKNLLKCVNMGMKAAGLEAATKVHITHNGTGPDAAHKKTPSLHNAGRAIDIQRIMVNTARGKYTFDFKKTNTNHVLSPKCAPAGTDNCEFWEAYRNCWHGLMKARACPSNRNPKRRWIGSLGWEDKKHIAHHLHMSYPFCPKSAGHWTTSFGDDEGETEDDFSPVPQREDDGGIDI